jgi:hypothetical protein
MYSNQIPEQVYNTPDKRSARVASIQTARSDANAAKHNRQPEDQGKRKSRFHIGMVRISAFENALSSRNYLSFAIK